MVDYITYKGEKLPIRLAYYLRKRIPALLGELKEGGNECTLIEFALFNGLKAGHIAENKEFIFKEEDMELILDECELEFTPMMYKFLWPPDGIPPKQEESEDKKK